MSDDFKNRSQVVQRAEEGRGVKLYGSKLSGSVFRRSGRINALYAITRVIGRLRFAGRPREMNFKLDPMVSCSKSLMLILKVP